MLPTNKKTLFPKPFGLETTQKKTVPKKRNKNVAWLQFYILKPKCLNTVLLYGIYVFLFSKIPATSSFFFMCFWRYFKCFTPKVTSWQERKEKKKKKIRARWEQKNLHITC